MWYLQCPSVVFKRIGYNAADEILLFFRRYKSSQFSSTVCLPRTTFPIKIGSDMIERHENEIQKVCKFEDLYHHQWEKKTKELFIMHDGPPYANGDVHVGHILNKILKDITNRYKLLKGFRIHYKPGWDCHGLPIEIKAIKNSYIETFGPLETRSKAKEFAKRTAKSQRNCFRRCGVMANWMDDLGCYYTYDKTYELRELQAFYKLYCEGLVFRDLKPVHWSPSSKTALAEAELEYNESHVSRSIYVSFPVLDTQTLETSDWKMHNCNILIWTTQPWTIPSNEMICYDPTSIYCLVKAAHENSKLDHDALYLISSDCIDSLSSTIDTKVEVVQSLQGSELEGIIYQHPLDPGRQAQLVSAEHVSAESGTGLVHTSPAHGKEDFLLAKKHGLPLQSYVDDEGFFTTGSGFGLEGKFIFTDGNSAVIDLLRQRKKLVHVDDYCHSYPYDWRTKKPTFMKTSWQWFIDTESLFEKASAALDDVHFHPEGGRNIMKHDLKQRTYWCISRQRVWGVPIPVFYNKFTGVVLLSEASMDHLLALIRENGSDVWWSLPIETLLPQQVIDRSGASGTSDDYVKGGDILDIWFDSGISWNAVLPDINSPKRADFYLEGKDQYGGWFFSSLLTSVALQNCAPYKQLFVHGFAVSESGRKMSKSLGNVIDPIVLVDGGKDKRTEPAYGADAVRWWVASSKVFIEVELGPKVMQNAANAVQKIRQCLRFALSNLGGFQSRRALLDGAAFRAIDLYYLIKLKQHIETIESCYDAYNFYKVAKHSLKFVNDLSNTYFSIVKDRLYCEDEHSELRLSSQTVMYYLLNSMIKMIAPILPHLAEEALLHHPCPLFSSAFSEGWCGVDFALDTCDQERLQAVETALTLKQSFNFGIGGMRSTGYDVVIVVPEGPVMEELKVLQLQNSATSTTDLCEILIAATCTLTSSSPPPTTATITVPTEVELHGNTHHCQVVVTPAAGHTCPRCRKKTASAVGGLCQRCTFVLSDSWHL